MADVRSLEERLKAWRGRQNSGALFSELDSIRELYWQARADSQRSDLLEAAFAPTLATLRGEEWVPPRDYVPVDWETPKRWWRCPRVEPSLPDFPSPAPRSAPLREEGTVVVQWGRHEVPLYQSLYDAHCKHIADVWSRRQDGVSKAELVRGLVTPAPLSEDLSVLKDSFLREGEVAVGMQTIPLLCPFTQTRIKVPARGALCKHVHVFDLFNWGEIVLRDGSTKPYHWKCPICSEYVLFGCVYISPYVSAVLASLPGARSADILSDGSFSRTKDNSAGIRRRSLSTGRGSPAPKRPRRRTGSLPPRIESPIIVS
eukprot:Hpha_TRINITY_DN33870_c0_g1::TRINITY_DN33870_c0_g1_i1::g.27313::m.27313